MRRSVIAAIGYRRFNRRIETIVALLFWLRASSDLLLIPVPFGLLGVLIFLAWVLMIAARPPLAVAWRCLAIGSRPLPPALTLTESLRARSFPRLPELASLEPLQRGRRMLLAQPVERGQQLLHVVRTKRRRLIVDDDGPVRVTRRHSVILRRSKTAQPANARIL